MRRNVDPSRNLRNLFPNETLSLIWLADFERSELELVVDAAV
jgi:hypothetical protein